MSKGIATRVTSLSVVLGMVVSALVATFNGLRSAQLAVNHSVNGGTYEYGYRWMHPSLGFNAGWMFLCAQECLGGNCRFGVRRV